MNQVNRRGRRIQFKRWLITLTIAVTTSWIFYDSYLMIKAVPYQEITKGSIRIIQGVENPVFVNRLGIIFVLYGFAGVVGIIALHKNKWWWRKLIFYSWMACFTTIAVTTWHYHLQLGLPIAIPVNLFCAFGYTYSRAAEMLWVLGLSLWFFIAGYWIKRLSSQMTLLAEQRTAND